MVVCSSQRAVTPRWLGHHTPLCATYPSPPHALPCVLITSQHGFINTKKPFASSSYHLCSLLRACAAPWCRASPPTRAAPPHLKPLTQSLMHQGSPHRRSRHRAAILCEKAPLRWVTAESTKGLTVMRCRRPQNWCFFGTLSSAVAPWCSKAPPTPLAMTRWSPHRRASSAKAAPTWNRLLWWGYPPWCTSIEFLNCWACSGHRPRPPIRWPPPYSGHHRCPTPWARPPLFPLVNGLPAQMAGHLEMGQPVLSCRNCNPCQFTLDLFESIQIGSNLQNFIAIQINSIKMWNQLYYLKSNLMYRIKI
jgi:hypothetical protein